MPRNPQGFGFRSSPQGRGAHLRMPQPRPAQGGLRLGKALQSPTPHFVLPPPPSRPSAPACTPSSLPAEPLPILQSYGTHPMTNTDGQTEEKQRTLQPTAVHMLLAQGVFQSITCYAGSSISETETCTGRCPWSVTSQETTRVSRGGGGVN